jgi:hypothetical protein
MLSRTVASPSPAHRVAVLAALLAAAVLAAGAPGRAAADPIQDTDATVQSLRQQADQASQQYFDALGAANALDAKIAALTKRLPGLAARRHALRAQAEHRAVAAYMRSGLALGALFDSADSLNAARRRQLLEGLNAKDDAVFVELARATQRIQAQRAALRDARAAQQSALDEVTARGRDIDAMLQAAVDRRNQLQTQAQAAEDAAAAAVPETTTTVAAAIADSAPPPAAPTEPPPGYKPTPGTHPHHADPFLTCTRERESSGNYAAVNPAGPYLGAYQFLQATWNSGANHAGRIELIGVPPNTASEYDQDDVAWAIYQWHGAAPWGTGCATP